MHRIVMPETHQSPSKTPSPFTHRIATATREEGPQGQRGRLPTMDLDSLTSLEHLMHALVVEDSPQIAERLVGLVSVPGEVGMGATAGTEDEALPACGSQPLDLPSVDLRAAPGTGF